MHEARSGIGHGGGPSRSAAGKDSSVNKCGSLGVEAPARQGARSAHTGSMSATSNPPSPGSGETSPKPGPLRARAEAGAAMRDASAAKLAHLFTDGS